VETTLIGEGNETFLIKWKSLPAGTPQGWIVKFHIGWIGEQSIPYKGVEASPCWDPKGGGL